MSKMGQFVFECQEIAENNYNETIEVVKSEVWEKFSQRPEVRQMAYNTTIEYWKEIQSDLELYG